MRIERSVFRRLLLPLSAASLAVACEAGPPGRDSVQAAAACNAPAVREVVHRFGERLKNVSLLAPDSVLTRQIREAYADLVTPELLDTWIAQPSRAPGREVSSPWPERIDIDSLSAADTQQCRVMGHVVYLTSADSLSSPPLRVLVRLTVQSNGAPRVSSCEISTGAMLDSTSLGGAVSVLRRYFEALAARDFRQAYALWGDGGAGSGRTFEEFAAGFERTPRVEAEIRLPGRIAGAAGSRYVEIPVVVRSTTASGTEQRSEGSYVLRYSVVPGATPEQRVWRIYAARVAPRR